MRKAGEVNEKDWPFSGNNWDEFYRELPDNVKLKGLSWLKDYEFGYEYVDVKDIKDALPYSPLLVGVYAWSQNSEGEYESRGQANHATTLVAYEGDNPIVFDSYEHSLKKLTKDHKIAVAMRFHLKKKDPKKLHTNWLIDLLIRFGLWPQ